MQIYNLISVILDRIFINQQKLEGIKIPAKIVGIENDKVKLNINGVIIDAQWNINTEPQINSRIMLLLTKIENGSIIFRLIPRDQETQQTEKKEKNSELDMTKFKKYTIEINDKIEDKDIEKKLKTTISSLKLDDQNLYGYHIMFKEQNKTINVLLSFKKKQKKAKLAKIMFIDELMGNVMINLMMIDKSLIARIVVEREETYTAFERYYEEMQEELKRVGYDRIRLNITKGSIREDSFLGEAIIEERV